MTNAKNQRCASKLRIWFQAFHGYADDHQGMIRWDQWDSAKASPNGCFYESYFPRITDSSALHGSSLTEFMRICPAVPSRSASGTCSYAMVRPRIDGNPMDAASNPQFGLGGISRPSDFVLMSDCVVTNGVNLDAAAMQDLVRPVCINPDSSQVRHGGGVNVLFGDGHVGFLTWPQASNQISVQSFSLN
jgi:prepilin-type processing-associated H-X9-DG protein